MTAVLFLAALLLIPAVRQALTAVLPAAGLWLLSHVPPQVVQASALAGLAVLAVVWFQVGTSGHVRRFA